MRKLAIVKNDDESLVVAAVADRALASVWFTTTPTEQPRHIARFNETAMAKWNVGQSAE